MYLFDTFTNFLSGLGVIGRDKLTGSQYVTTIWSRQQLEAAYRGDWIARKAISIPAFDATREWRSWQAEQQQIEALEDTEKRLQVQLKMQQTLTKARLYGGCCILIGVDGNPEEELIPEDIPKDGLKFLHVLAPHQLTIDTLVRDLEDPYYGQPEFYVLRDETEKFGDAKVHPSRMVRLIGLEPPDPMLTMGWGDPMLQTIHDAVNAAGTVTSSLATLISEAKLDVIKIPGLTEIFSTSAGTNRLIKRFTEANVAKSVVNGIIMDAEEEWQRIEVQWRGMPEVLQMYLQIAAGAADIPVTRFLGMSPAGMNATGESDLQNYYDRIKSDQELRLQPALEKLDKAIQQSALGSYDENIFYEWNSLWQMDDGQKATIAKQRADVAMLDVNAGLIPMEALARGRVNQLIEDGTYPGLESAIEEALKTQETLVTEPPMMGGAPGAPDGSGVPGVNGKGNGSGNGIQPGRATASPVGVGDTEVAGHRVGPFGMKSRTLLRTQLRTVLSDLWNESLHPRGQPENAGQFGPGGGSSGGSAGFVSPNVKTDLNFKGAVKELKSDQQSHLRAASADINSKVGITGAKEIDIVGAWKDGAENSLMLRSDAGWDKTVLATVMKGHIADQKSVLVFQQDPEGKSVLAQFDATGPLDTIHENLLQDGIENHTVVPKDGGATVYVAYLDGNGINNLDKAAQRYGKDNEVYYQNGRAEFIGNTDESGTDRQQRDRARSVYEDVIAQSTVQNAQAIWQDVRDTWSAPAKVAAGDTPDEAKRFATEKLIDDGPREGTSRVRVVKDPNIAIWGASHSGSSTMTGEAAKVMGIDGYKDMEAGPEAQKLTNKFLDVIAKGQGAGETLYHGFDNAISLATDKRIEFKAGDTMKLPLLAASGDFDNSASYGLNYNSSMKQNEGATVFEFPAHTPIAGYSRWDRNNTKDFGHTWSEAVVAGEFKVTGVGQRRKFEYPVTVVSLEPVSVYDRTQKAWRKL